MPDSPAITAAKARADATDYVRIYGPDDTFWTHCIEWQEATSADYAVALELIERTDPKAHLFIAHLRLMRDIRAQGEVERSRRCAQYDVPIGPTCEHETPCGIPCSPCEDRKPGPSPDRSFPRYAYFAQDDVFVVVMGDPEHHEVPIRHPMYGDTSVHEDALEAVSVQDVKSLPPLPFVKYEDDASKTVQAILHRDPPAFGAYLGALAKAAREYGDVDMAFGMTPALPGLEHRDPSPLERRLVAILVSGV